jgi:hypothetical protein
MAPSILWLHWIQDQYNLKLQKEHNIDDFLKNTNLDQQIQIRSPGSCNNSKKVQFHHPHRRVDCLHVASDKSCTRIRRDE